MGLTNPLPTGVIFDPVIHKLPVTDDALAQEIIDREFDPEIHKAPVTKEYMALAVAGKIEVEPELLACFSDALYESVSGMIYKIVRKYCFNPDDATDLAHDCVLRIFQSIYQYDPLKGKFTTWSWRVASSVVCRKMDKKRQYKERFVDCELNVEEMEVESNLVAEMSGDVAVALLKLFDEYPEKRDILTEMFCREDGTMYVPDRISMRKIAETLGRDYTDVYSFVRNKVRPFVAETFGGDNE